VRLRVFSRRLERRPRRTASARPAWALPFLPAFRDASSDCPSVAVWKQISWSSVQAEGRLCADPDRRPVWPADRADLTGDRETRRRIPRPVSRPNCLPAALLCQHRFSCCCVCWSTPLSLPRYTSAPHGTGRRLDVGIRKRNASGAQRAERLLTSRGSVGCNWVVSVGERSSASTVVDENRTNRSVDPVLPHADVELLPGETERLCRLRFVETGAAKRFVDHCALHRLQVGRGAG
jgi:hypothetical protein